MSGGILKSRDVSMLFGGSSICSLDLRGAYGFFSMEQSKS